jgi:SAM-dependent MidA family methyltransferase
MAAHEKVGASKTAPTPPDTHTANARLRAQGAVNLLLSPNEMGELFKVIAIGRGLPPPLLGFTRGDRVHSL